MITPITCINWNTMQLKAKEVLQTSTVPFFIITAEKDETVSTKAIKDFFAQS